MLRRLLSCGMVVARHVLRVAGRGSSQASRSKDKHWNPYERVAVIDLAGNPQYHWHRIGRHFQTLRSEFDLRGRSDA